MVLGEMKKPEDAVDLLIDVLRADPRENRLLRPDPLSPRFRQGRNFFPRKGRVR